MWVICNIGFFNIICQDDDAEKDLLTVKSRSIADLERFHHYCPCSNIEESLATDYRFRVKASKSHVMEAMALITRDINYPKTKPKLKENNPNREAIYLNVWGNLYGIQEIDETV